MEKIIIAIDGLSGCGKSTLARELASELDYLYIDTGAMYRAITLYFIENKIDWANIDKCTLENCLKKIHLRFKKSLNNGRNEILLNGKRVEDKIRKIKIAQHVSEVAALLEVRTLAVKQQKEMAQDKGVVMDGRDIGTVVFPDAELKIYLTARTDVRVERRFKELVKKNSDIKREDIRKNLLDRDDKDMHRAISPLRQAEDAVVIDNSDLSREDQLKVALGWVEKVMMNDNK